MGGSGPRLDECATEIYAEWAACQHFFLYDDVAPVLQELAARGLKIGLISNSHRCLASFQEHFRAAGSDHGGRVLVRARLHEAAPEHLRGSVDAGWVEARDSLMVGDSMAHDIDGARRVGMRGVLVHRSDDPVPATGVPVIRSMTELPASDQLTRGGSSALR